MGLNTGFGYRQGFEPENRLEIIQLLLWQQLYYFLFNRPI